VSSYGLAIVALAATVSPGVIFVLSFFNFSIIKRNAITFGPAVDLAVFFCKPRPRYYVGIILAILAIIIPFAISIDVYGHLASAYALRHHHR